MHAWVWIANKGYPGLGFRFLADRTVVEPPVGVLPDGPVNGVLIETVGTRKKAGGAAVNVEALAAAADAVVHIRPRGMLFVAGRGVEASLTYSDPAREAGAVAKVLGL